MTKHDALELLRLMRMDLTQLQARLTTIKVAVANSDWTDTASDALLCPRCGVAKRSSQTLQDHLLNVHHELYAVSQSQDLLLANDKEYAKPHG